MLVVIGIIAALIAASIGSYSAVIRSAERAKCRELVDQVAMALATLYQREGNWPKRLAMQGKTDGRLDAETAVALKDYYSLNVNDEGKLEGYDRFGIVSPWALTVIKSRGRNAKLDTDVSDSKDGKKTVEDHILHYALDLDGDGIIQGAMVGGESVDVRATAIVWCGGKDGLVEPYTKGRKGDDIYSWSPGQAQKVK